MVVKDIDIYIKNYTTLKRNFKVRKSKNYVEFVADNGRRLFYNKNDTFSKGLFLFRMVNNDIKKFLEENGRIEPYHEMPTNYYNSNYDVENTKTIGVDINNAYWKVAFLKGYISKKTYNKGLSKNDLKSVRLSTLSSLGKEKVYQVYEKGLYKHDEVHRYDKALQDIYNDIRFCTYAVMYECAEELGDDFYCWKTDCINFKDTQENRKKVMDLIESYDLECKIEEFKISKKLQRFNRNFEKK
tara:strand:- start:2413 stop:3138 length:726 start_codon:yes stop_codon:yes gene_type:complete